MDTKPAVECLELRDCPASFRDYGLYHPKPITPVILVQVPESLVYALDDFTLLRAGSGHQPIPLANFDGFDPAKYAVKVGHTLKIAIFANQYDNDPYPFDFSSQGLELTSQDKGATWYIHKSFGGGTVASLELLAAKDGMPLVWCQESS
jgi:hypothetical protein